MMRIWGQGLLISITTVLIHLTEKSFSDNCGSTCKSLTECSGGDDPDKTCTACNVTLGMCNRPTCGDYCGDFEHVCFGAYHGENCTRCDICKYPTFLMAFYVVSFLNSILHNTLKLLPYTIQTVGTKKCTKPSCGDSCGSDAVCRGADTCTKCGGEHKHNSFSSIQIDVSTTALLKQCFQALLTFI